MITDTRVEIGADRICTIVPKELNSDKNKTVIEQCSNNFIFEYDIMEIVLSCGAQNY